MGFYVYFCFEAALLPAFVQVWLLHSWHEDELKERRTVNMVKRQEVSALQGRDSSATDKSSKCALQPGFRHCPTQ